MKNKLLLLSLLFIISFGHLQSQEYEYDWQPDSGSIFGNPWKINFVNKFVAIGRDLAPNVFDLDDAWLRLNGGLWHKANAIYEPGASHPYQIQLVAPEFVAKTDTSFVQLRIREVSGDEYVYAQALYFYSSPQLDVTKVNGVDYNPEVPLTLSPDISVFQIELHAYALFGAESQPEESFGSARIKRLEFANNAEFSDSDVIIISEEYNAEVAFNLLDYFSLDDESLHYGHNTIYFRAVGVGNDHSSITELPIFIFDFEANDSYCKYDENYPLEGKPKGGRFSGECIFDSTMMFNPSLAEGNSTIVHYEYMVRDSVFVIEKEIDLFELPVFSLKGDVQVCGNEHGAEYIMEGNVDSTHWLVAGAKNYHVLHDGTLFVNWESDGTGIITAEVFNEFGCSVRTNYLVDIGKRKAPEDSAYLIRNDRMLICSDTNVNYYYWYAATGNEFLGRTDYQNYFALAFQPAASDSFYVMTAYDTLGCATHSFFSKDETSLKLLPQDYLKVAPNPTTGVISFQLAPHPATKLKLVIYHVDGQLVYTESIAPTNKTEDFYIDLGSFKNGIYMLYLYGGRVSLFRKVVLAN